jgi:cold shock CspA family protein
LGAGYGTITSLKSDFGFIHRDPKFGDGEIFFHYSEVSGGIEALRIGMDVEYGEVQQTNDKMRAVEVAPLPAGYFDAVDSAVVEGTVTHAISETGKRKGGNECVTLPTTKGIGS